MQSANQRVLHLLHDLQASRVAVIQQVPWSGFDVLIGRDVLSKLRVVFYGLEQRLVITG